MNKFLDVEKALEVLLYVSHKTNNLFNIVKVLYYADKIHLERYGRQITGDYYVAMEDGPVASGAYDLIRIARGDKTNWKFDSKIVEIHPERSINASHVSKNRTIVKPLRSVNLDLISESDLECLDEAIESYGHMDTNKLWILVHKEKAYNNTERDKQISLKQIILEDIPNGNDVLEYLAG